MTGFNVDDNVVAAAAAGGGDSLMSIRNGT